MTPREKREELTRAIIQDVLSNVCEGSDNALIARAIESHLAHWRAHEVEDEYKRRARL
jgi:hypothetical protein